jgi:hypothetical protein
MLIRTAVSFLREPVRQAAGWPRIVVIGCVLLGAVVPLAAADDAGVTQLSHGVSAEAVKSLPEWNATSGRFIPSVEPTAPYIYHLVGGEARGFDCGTTDPHPTNNIYVTSTAALSVEQLKELQQTYLAKVPGLLPPSVTSISNGCPTPGVAGQPGTQNSPSAPGAAAVTVDSSNRVAGGSRPEAPTVSLPGH